MYQDRKLKNDINILILSAGTRNLLVQYFKESGFNKVIAVDASSLAPALYFATGHYIVPSMRSPDYLQKIEDICEKEQIKVILPLQEDELEILTEAAERFERKGIMVMVSDASTIKLCRDKYAFYQFLKKNNIPTLATFSSTNQLEKALDEKQIDFPVFMKPRFGCGSIDSFVINGLQFIHAVMENYKEEFVIQQFNTGKEYGVDVFVDCVSGEITNIFAKEKIRMRAGETEKSMSVIDTAIYSIVEETLSHLKCRGPIDMDLFKIQDQYYVSEINPRFGGGYPHAYLCGINFPKYILYNANGIENKKTRGQYQEGMIALKTQGIIQYPEDVK